MLPPAFMSCVASHTIPYHLTTSCHLAACVSSLLLVSDFGHAEESICYTWISGTAAATCSEAPNTATMMASKVLSRFLPGTESVFDGPRRNTDVETDRMLEGGGPSDHEGFHDFDEEQEMDNLLVEAQSTPPRRHGSIPQSSLAPSRRGRVDQHSVVPTASQARSPSPTLDNDIPASLLMEAAPPNIDSPEIAAQHQPQPEQPPQDGRNWSRAQEQQQLFHDEPPQSANTFTSRVRPTRRQQNPREKVMWLWANVENVDGFLLELYQYYTEHGIWSILLSRVIRLLATAFLFSAFMFLSTCIDYSKIPSSKSTAEILIPKCMAKASFFKNLGLWIFVFWWTWTAFRYVTDIRRLRELHDFYHHALGIPDTDIQSIAWERVVESLMSLRDANPETADKNPNYLRKVAKTTQSKQRMDAHDIANRLMRRDNYYIALINKEIFDLQLDLPFLGPRNFYSKSLEKCISNCFENFIFDSHGNVQPHCLDPKKREWMIETLRARFRQLALMSIFTAPIDITYQCIFFFSRYYAEFRNSPAQLVAREFTPLAEWKMRDFNELDHDLQCRLKMAYKSADNYLAQFPKDKTIQFLQFVSLVAGTVAGVLGLATLFDPELFLGFEVTSGRTAFFYLSVSLAICAAVRNAVPDESEVHDPVFQLFDVIEFTHYCPQRWRNNFHTPAVRAEFSSLYQLKITIFFEEILSLVAAPFVLWRNAGKPSAAIVDFFRQNTVHVDGLGGLCNHAVFEFRKRTRPEDDDASDARELYTEYYGIGNGGGAAIKDQKMAQSQYYFMQRLGRYEGRQAERYTQGHYRAFSGATQRPPTFPPLTPLREAANGRSHQRRSQSPRQSVLLDLQDQHSNRRRASGRAGAGMIGRKHSDDTGRRRRRASDDLVLPRAEADLTTSKLIDADNSLADSWKIDQEEDETAVNSQARTHGASSGRGSGREANGGNRDAGIVGLLMEYTKGQQGIKKAARLG